jgi:ribosomal protein S18 acetylase RimI-like enzyme
MDRDMTAQTSIRNALPEDFDAVIALDSESVKEEKPAYWQGIFDRYVSVRKDSGFFLVAETGGKIIGFIVSEVRAWEFGSPPCGWVFAIGVSPEKRELGVGQLMLDEICKRLQQAGVMTVRTMVDREDKLTLSFFRSQGLRTGRYIELEKPLDDINQGA